MSRYRVHVKYRSHFMGRVKEDTTLVYDDLESARAARRCVVSNGWQVFSHQEWVEIECPIHGWQPVSGDECIECYAEQANKELEILRETINQSNP